jgi:hypothetical protein
MLIGYARVSSNDQDTAAQVAALKAPKCERIYGEQAFLAAAVRAVQCTLVAIKRNPPISAYYRRLCAAGKPSKVALIACIRKLAVMLNALVRNGTSWSPMLVPA